MLIKQLIFCLHTENIKNSKTYKNSKINIRPSLTLEERKEKDAHYKEMQGAIKELKKKQDGNEYIIYAHKICIKHKNRKPEPINHELNKKKNSNGISPATGANATPIQTVSYQNTNSSFQDDDAML
jgi:hypothetical protein